MVDVGSIPVAVADADHVVRCMAIERSGDPKIFETALSDSHARVRESALKRMQSISTSIESADALLGDSELGARAADIRLPELIAENQIEKIASLCDSPNAEMRRILAKHLKGVDWYSWTAFVNAARHSQDRMLLPRLLRSRREPEATSLRKTLLMDSEQMVQTRILEDLHGRIVSEEVLSVVEDLTNSDDSLVASTASSLIADISALKGV